MSKLNNNQMLDIIKSDTRTTLKRSIMLLDTGNILACSEAIKEADELLRQSYNLVILCPSPRITINGDH